MWAFARRKSPTHHICKVIKAEETHCQLDTPLMQWSVSPVSKASGGSLIPPKLPTAMAKASPNPAIVKYAAVQGYCHGLQHTVEGTVVQSFKLLLLAICSWNVLILEEAEPPCFLLTKLLKICCCVSCYQLFQGNIFCECFRTLYLNIH